MRRLLLLSVIVAALSPACALFNRRQDIVTEECEDRNRIEACWDQHEKLCRCTWTRMDCRGKVISIKPCPPGPAHRFCSEALDCE